MTTCSSTGSYPENLFVGSPTVRDAAAQAMTRPEAAVPGA